MESAPQQSYWLNMYRMNKRFVELCWENWFFCSIWRAEAQNRIECTIAWYMQQLGYGWGLLRIGSSQPAMFGRVRSHSTNAAKAYWFFRTAEWSQRIKIGLLPLTQIPRIPFQVTLLAGLVAGRPCADSEGDFPLIGGTQDNHEVLFFKNCVSFHDTISFMIIWFIVM